MTTMPLEGTKVKIVGKSADAFEKTINNFVENNEFIVVGAGRMVKGENGKEFLVNIKSTRGVMGGQILQFFKSELEEME